MGSEDWFSVTPGQADVLRVPAAGGQTTWVEIDGPLEAARVTEVVRGVVQRYDCLRAVFRESGLGGFEQRVADASETTPDIRLLDVGEVEDDLFDRFATKMAQSTAISWDLQESPPFRVHLIRRDPLHHVLLVAFHPAVVDAQSGSTILRTLLSGVGADGVLAEDTLAPGLYRAEVEATAPTTRARDADARYWESVIPHLMARDDVPTVQTADLDAAQGVLPGIDDRELARRWSQQGVSAASWFAAEYRSFLTEEMGMSVPALMSHTQYRSGKNREACGMFAAARPVVLHAETEPAAIHRALQRTQLHQRIGGAHLAGLLDDPARLEVLPQFNFIPRRAATGAESWNVDGSPVTLRFRRPALRVRHATNARLRVLEEDEGWAVEVQISPRWGGRDTAVSILDRLRRKLTAGQMPG